jgi:hypothetical protein
LPPASANSHAARNGAGPLEPDEGELLRLLVRWRAEATKMGCTITRIAVAYEAGRDGFWLARWLRGDRSTDLAATRFLSHATPAGNCASATWAAKITGLIFVSM